MSYLIEDVFSPRSFPQNTYIYRKTDSGESVDARLKRALAMRGNLIFVSGASKSGKTVLCHNVIAEDKYIGLSGNQIGSKEDFWNHVAEQIPLSDSIVTTSSEQSSNASGNNMGVNVNLGVLAIHAGANSNQGEVANTQIALSKSRTERQIIRYLIDNDKVLIIDDFHYVAKDVQMYIARTLKTELFNGLKAVIISLPHRSDEAIICNPDLIGRTTSIEIPPWDKAELKEIAVKGFKLLKLDISDDDVELLARESITSPQLMQDNCFNLAFAAVNNYLRINSGLVQSAFRETASNYSHYERIVKNITLGPLQGRGRRKLYELQDSSVDIYNLLLLALKADPPVVSLDIAELKQRTSVLLMGNQQLSSSVISATINKIIRLVREVMPELDAFEYSNQCLYILDPFLLFYLRWKN